MHTLKELKRYLENECYSKVVIGKVLAEDCLILWEERRRYFFGYCERGRISVIKEFDTEKDLVVYALDELEKDIWARAHLAAWTWSEEEIKEAEQELERMHIAFKRNDIPNFDRVHGRAYRIFVFGRDIRRLSDFKKKYLER